MLVEQLNKVLVQGVADEQLVREVHRMSVFIGQHDLLHKVYKADWQ